MQRIQADSIARTVFGAVFVHLPDSGWRPMGEPALRLWLSTLGVTLEEEIPFSNKWRSQMDGSK